MPDPLRVEVVVPCGRVSPAGWCTDGGACPDDCSGHTVAVAVTGRSALLLALGEAAYDFVHCRDTADTEPSHRAQMNALVEEMARDLVALGSGLPGDDRMQFDLLMAQRRAEAAAIREGNDG